MSDIAPNPNGLRRVLLGQDEYGDHRLFYVGHLSVANTDTRIMMGVAKPIELHSPTKSRNLGEVMPLWGRKVQVRWLQEESTLDPRINALLHGTDALDTLEIEAIHSMLNGMPASLNTIHEAALGIDPHYSLLGHQDTTLHLVAS